MTSSQYGTAGLQGDASPSSPKSYRVSKVAKIALALIVCGTAAVIAHPGTRQTTINFELGSWTSERLNAGRSSGGGAPAESTSLEDEVQDLEARVAAIEKFLKKGKGGSGNSRASASRAMGLSGAFVDSFAARRRLKDHDAGTSLKDQLQDLQGRVAAIEKYLQAASASGGSGTSRGSASRAMGLSGAVVDSFAARRRLWLQQFHGKTLSYGRSSDGAASSTIEDQVQDLQARVAAIEKYLQATSRGSASRVKAAAGF